MPYVALAPENFSGQVVGSGQCVAFVQTAAKAPLTAFWKQGINVRGASLAKGTAIATFQDGKYQNRLNGDSHAAIYTRQDATGIYVWEQWTNHPVSERHIRFKGGKGTPNNDGDAYFVIAANSDQGSTNIRRMEMPKPFQTRIC